MASDGCQPVPSGQAFPYLFQYRRQSPGPVAPEQLPALPADKTGTWNGPKPTGLEVRVESGARAESATVQEPETLLLRGGARLPLLGFGTYKVGSAEIIKAALAAGHRAFDAASVYGNEATVGEGLQDFIASGLRSDLFLTTKIYNDAHQPEAVRASCRQSVADLGCNYIDLLLMHWPEAWLPGTKEPDTSVTIQQTWLAMEELVDEGLVRSLGVANFSLAQLEALLVVARIRPVVLQVELHPLLAQRKLVGVCMRKGVRCVAYSPLGHGSTELFDLPEVQHIASETGRSPAQVA